MTLRSLESQGVRLVVALLLGLAVMIGSVVLLYFPIESVLWLPVAGLGIALATAVVSWRPFMYVVVGWSALLTAGCVLGLVEFTRAEAPAGVFVVLMTAAFCAASAGLLELALLLRRPHATPTLT